MEEKASQADSGFCNHENEECWFMNPHRLKSIRAWLKENREYIWDSAFNSYVRHESDGSFVPIDEGRLQREVKLGVK